jgi:hypothetical protein
MARELLGMETGAESEAVKLNAIRDALDRAGLGAKAEVSLEIKPWELLMGDIAGVATISRAEHLAHQGAFVIDAELDDPVDESPPPLDGPENRPRSPEDERNGPEGGEVPGGDMPKGSDPPTGHLMTLEEATEMRIGRT